MTKYETTIKQDYCKTCKHFLYSVLFISTFPAIIYFLGINLDFINFAEFPIKQLHIKDQSDFYSVFNVYGDTFLYTVLEFGTILTILFSLILSLAHFKATKSKITLIISLFLVFCGLNELLNIIISNNLLHNINYNESSVIFNWTVSRIFISLITLYSLYILVISPDKKENSFSISITNMILIFLIMNSIIIYSSFNITNYPEMEFPYLFFQRPYDLISLIIFITTLTIFYPKTSGSKYNYTVYGVALSTIPNAIAQIHVIIGSKSLYDINYNIAHILIIFSLLTILFGLILDFLEFYKNEKRVIESLKITQENLKDINNKLNIQYEELREANNKFKAISEGAQDAVIMINNEGQVTFWNESAEKIFGYSQEEILGKDLHSILAPEQYKPLYTNGLKQFKTTGKGDGIGKIQELIALKKDGTEFTIELSLSAIKLKNEWNAVGILRDISIRKKLENELKEKLAEIENLVQIDKKRLIELNNANIQLITANKEAAIANKSKSDFLANMSHEIRTPMNSIMGMSRLLSDTLLSLEQKEYLDLIISSTQNLLRIINDILDFSKIEAGKLSLDLVKFNIRDNIAHSLKTFAYQAQEKGIKLEYNISNNVPSFIIGDPIRLNQVLINLIGNAIKFTEKGKVSLNVELNNIQEDKMHILFNIKDTGIGIPDDRKEEIFKSFSQLDSSLSRKYEGSGLGLAISSQLINMMNGTIWVESELNKGSSFYFTAEFYTKHENIKELQIGLKEISALIISNDENNLDIYNKILSYWNINITIAKDNIQAIKEINNKINTNNAYSFIIYESDTMENIALKNILAINTIYNTPIIVASDKTTDINFTSKSNKNIHVLAKPININNLINTIFKIAYTEKATKPKPLDKAELLAIFSHIKTNILLVDDNKVNQLFVKRLLEKQNINVYIANDGKEAINMYNNNTFNLILMDIQMPEMSGFEATKIIRNKEKLNDTYTPIIAITAHAMKGDREKCIEAGMDNYISKPIDPDELFKIIINTINNIIDYPKYSLSKNNNELKIFNSEILMKRMSYDEELIIELIELFMETTPSLMNEIEKSLTEKEPEILENLMHKLKGSLSNISAFKASQTAENLQLFAQQSKFDEFSSTFKELENDIKELFEVLIEFISAHK